MILSVSAKMSRNHYPENEMENAINAVKNLGMSIRAAAKQFKVPRMTLSDKCRGKTPIIRKMGPSPVLLEMEEKNLEKWIVHLGENGFPVTKDHLLDSVQMLMKKFKRDTPFTNDRPGKHWYQAFLKRHPILTQRVSQNLTRTRAGVTEINIKNWFKEIKDYLQEKNLFDIVLNSGNRVFNCDETAFFLSPADNKVLVRKGQKNVHNIINSDEKENITTLLMGNADGQIAPPMVVVKLKRVPKSLTESVPSSWAIGRSDNGWMTSQTFFEYFSMVFYPWLVENDFEFPIIIFLDGHVSHLTLPLSEFCSEKNIELIALYPNSTHFLQPMDVAMFHPLKAAWKKEVYKWRIENSGTRLKRDNFCPLLHKVLESTCKGSILKNGFRACGLFPFNPDAITYFKMKHVQSEPDGEKQRKPTIPDTEANLQFIEDNIPKEKLQLFLNSGGTWSGDIEDTSLFYFWRNIRELKSRDMEAEIEDITQNEVNGGVFDGILGNRDFVDFEVGVGGVLEEVEEGVDVWIYMNDVDIGLENEINETNETAKEYLENASGEKSDEKENPNETNETAKEYLESASGEKSDDKENPDEKETPNETNETAKQYLESASGEKSDEKENPNETNETAKEYLENANGEISDKKENPNETNETAKEYLENASGEKSDEKETPNETNETAKQYLESASGEKSDEKENPNETNETAKEYLENASGEKSDEKENPNETNETAKQYLESACGEKSDEKENSNETNETAKEYLESASGEKSDENNISVIGNYENAHVTPPSSPRPTSSNPQRNIPLRDRDPF